MARDRELTEECRITGALVGPARKLHRHPLEPILVSGLLAMSLHAALLSVPVREARAPVQTGGSGLSEAMSVRILARRVEPGIGASNEHVAAVGPTLSIGLASGRVPEESARGVLVSRLGSASISPEPGGLALRLPGVLGEDDFFGRQSLDVPPVPVAPVLIEYPAAGENAGTHASELTLFIDEAGNVVRVRVDGQLPPAMEAAARSAFMGARFAPGHVDGLAVRSKIRIEVLFEEGTPRR
jgi:hypothetical protein